MKIIIAPNEFKGSLSALKVATHIERGIKRVFSSAICELYPVADGGDGTLDVMIQNTGGKFISIPVFNPLGEEMQARLGIIGETAVVEMAEASGLRLLKRDQLNPMHTTTYGTGQLIKAALDYGCKRIVVGVGGSATVEGGIGMAQALGAKLLDAHGNEIAYGGAGLLQLQTVDLSGLDPRLQDVKIQVACDVTNPLLGETGAARVFAPQKGADAQMVVDLERGLTQLADVIQRDLNKSVAEMTSGGAAGGLATGLYAFLGAELVSGVDLILDIIGLEAHIQDADFVITGEGRIDNQTAYGKAPAGVLRLARKYNVPVVALAGGVAGGVEFDAVLSIVDAPQSLDDAMQSAAILTENAAERMMRLIKVGGSLLCTNSQ